MPPVQIQLGEMAAFATIVESMVRAERPKRRSIPRRGVPSKTALTP